MNELIWGLTVYRFINFIIKGIIIPGMIILGFLLVKDLVEYVRNKEEV